MNTPSDNPTLPELRELRLESLRSDGALVPLLEGLEDVIRGAKAVSLANVGEEVERLTEENEEHESAERELLEVVGEGCSDLVDVANVFLELREARDAAETRRDEQRDALHRLQDAVTKIAHGMSRTDPGHANDILVAVAASDDGTPAGLRGKATHETQRKAHETKLQALKVALDERDAARTALTACNEELNRLRTANLPKRRARARKVQP